MPADRRPRRVWLAASAGVASVLFGFGFAQLLAGFISPNAGPVVVVGSAIIDLVPGWVKDAVVAAFGTGDKTFLIVCIGVVLLVLSGLCGILDDWRPPWGRAIVVAGGGIGAIAALTRSDATAVSAIPSIIAGIVGATALPFLLGRMRPREAPQTLSAVARRAGEQPAAPASATLDRRGFFRWTAAAAAVGALTTLGGQLLGAASTAATAARAALRLPRPVKPGPPVPAGASFDIPGLSPIVTSNADFYRIDTALVVPEIDPATWSLEVTGMVEKPFTLSWNELLALPLDESVTTLTCVSNPVGGDLVSNARWLGYPVRELLARAGVTGDADMVYSTSHDGWTASTPLGTLTDPNRNAILAVGMNGQPLPFEHGFPARLVVPGLYGYVSATKWVVKLEVTRFADHVSYWTERGWSEQGPIKQSSRIDVPRDGTRVQAGEVTVAGVAWDQHTGIAAVEVQVDDGAWQKAALAEAIDLDTWRQWRYSWVASAGDHSLKVRATNRDGQVQTSAIADVVPNGATGLHTISVSVA